MYTEFRTGIADTENEFDRIATYAADMALDYPVESFIEWVHEKFRPRMQAGLIVPCPAFYDTKTVAITATYPEPPQNPGDMPGVEVKLWRTMSDYHNWGLGRVTLKGAFNESCRRMSLDPGTPVRVHLDTRDPLAAQAFEAQGFKETGQAQLYGSDDPTNAPLDRLFEKIVHVPENLYAI